jgi:hypothetical protein
MQVQIGKQTRDTLREHGLTHSRRAMEEHVMPTGCSYLTSPHRLDLTDHVCQVETTVRMPADSLTHNLDGINRLIAAQRSAERRPTVDAPFSSTPKTPALLRGSISPMRTLVLPQRLQVQTVFCSSLSQLLCHLCLRTRQTSPGFMGTHHP